MSKVYIAAPFFNPTQLERVESVKKTLREQGIDYFSPKDESMFKQGDDPAEILKLNCAAIDKAPYVIVITDDKDVGTIWEAGYSYAKGKKILYLWLGWKPEMKFNIMLAASGVAVHNYDDLSYQLLYYSVTGVFDDGNAEDFIYE